MTNEKKENQLGKIAQEFKKPEVKIPDGAICELLLYDVNFSEKARAKAKETRQPLKLTDGLLCRFILLKYWDKEKEVVCVDYSDPNIITFPCDLKDAAGGVTYAGLESFEFINNIRLKGKTKYGGFATTDKDDIFLGLASTSLSLQYGGRDTDLLHLVLGRETLTQLTYEDYASYEIKKPEKLMFPIYTVYRYIDWKYKREDLDDKWQPKEGAKKDQVDIKFSMYNREKKIYDLEVIDTKYIPEETVNAIYTSILTRRELKNKAAEAEKKSKAGASPFTGGGKSTLTDPPF